MFQLIARHLLHTLNIIVVESFTTPHHYCPMSVQPLPAFTVTSKRAKKEKRPVAKIDFQPYGAAITAGRTKQKESRNKAADAQFISPRYLANIENKGQHPSVQVFLELMSRYHISVDQILHGETMEGKSTERMQFETLLDELTDAEIKILTATAQALLDARTDSEGEN